MEKINKRSSEEKVCTRCGALLTEENSYPSLLKQHRYICRKCEVERQKEWQQSNLIRHRATSREKVERWRERNPDYSKKHDEQLKLEVLSHYANPLKCDRCGTDDIRVLTIDHIKGGGSEHRKKVGTHIYRWLKKNNYPEGYQVLCFNCNWIKRLEED